MPIIIYIHVVTVRNSSPSREPVKSKACCAGPFFNVGQQRYFDLKHAFLDLPDTCWYIKEQLLEEVLRPENVPFFLYAPLDYDSAEAKH